MPVQLEIFFDLSCPFCLLAKLTVDDVLRSAATPVEVTWSPLILLPFLPANGIDFQTAHVAKYGERARELQLHVERRAEGLGLMIDHARIAKVPNTIDAHRAVRFAADAGRAGEMIEALLRAYFVDYQDITDRSVLAEVVQSTGLDAAEFRARIGSDWLRSEVLAAHESSVRRGARSVPSYRLNGTHIENTSDLISALRGRLAPVRDDDAIRRGRAPVGRAAHRPIRWR
jgi:predicted DsbA family dithiol-disulfide isomerase